MRDLTQAEFDQRRFGEAWENQGMDSADRVLRAARPTEAPPSAPGSIQVPALGRTTGVVLPERKRCGCGASFTLEEFQALPLLGFVGDLVERAELRNCPSCHSTLGITHVGGRVILNG